MGKYYKVKVFVNNRPIATNVKFLYVQRGGSFFSEHDYIKFNRGSVIDIDNMKSIEPFDRIVLYTLSGSYIVNNLKAFERLNGEKI